MKGILDTLGCRIFLGTGFGSDMKRTAAFALFDAFYELGGRGIDTAMVYHNAEDLLGEWLKVNGVRDVVINAKGGLHEGSRPRLDRESLYTDVQRTRDRLGLDTLGIFTLHRDDRDRCVEEILDTVCGLLADGMIACYGTSNWRTERIRALEARAAARSVPPPVLSSVNLSLAFPNFEIWPNVEHCCDTETRSWYRSRQYPLLAWGCVGCGFLGDIAPTDADRRGRVSRVYGSPRNWERLKRADQAAAATGLSRAQIAWLWVLAQGLNLYPICGAHTIAQLKAAFAVEGTALSAAAARWLNLEMDVPPEAGERWFHSPVRP